jgi:hypothetical protein
MKISVYPLVIYTIMILFLFIAVILAGCVSSKSSQVNEPLPISPSISQNQNPTVQPTITHVSTTSMVQTETTNPQLKLFSNSQYGITMYYPNDWKKEELYEIGLRDYGKETINIANFISPDITGPRVLEAGSNPDPSSYTMLSIDIDPNYTEDFEQYFNLVCLAIQKYYGTIKITRHNFQNSISVTDASHGYKCYQLDFDTQNMRASYTFSYVDGTMYIFVFKNPSPYSKEVLDMYQSIRIVPPVKPQHYR